jgi:hypothetical protein
MMRELWGSFRIGTTESGGYAMYAVDGMFRNTGTAQVYTTGNTAGQANFYTNMKASYIVVTGPQNSR